MVATRNMKKLQQEKFARKRARKFEKLRQKNEKIWYEKYGKFEQANQKRAIETMDVLWKLQNFDLHQTKLVLDGFENNNRYWQIIEQIKINNNDDCEVCRHFCEIDSKNAFLEHEKQLLDYQSKNQEKILAVKNAIYKLINEIYLQWNSPHDGLFTKASLNF